MFEELTHEDKVKLVARLSEKILGGRVWGLEIIQELCYGPDPACGYFEVAEPTGVQIFTFRFRKEEKKTEDVATKARRMIDEIQEIRKDNNVYWMDLMRLAFDRAPTEALALMRLILEKDEQVTAAVRKLVEEAE